LEIARHSSLNDSLSSIIKMDISVLSCSQWFRLGFCCKRNEKCSLSWERSEVKEVGER